jgi:hypothetical protein
VGISFFPVSNLEALEVSLISVPHAADYPQLDLVVRVDYRGGGSGKKWDVLAADDKWCLAGLSHFAPSGSATDPAVCPIGAHLCVQGLWPQNSERSVVETEGHEFIQTGDMQD